MSERKVIPVAGVSNEEFLARHAAPGRVGLAGGVLFVDRAIRRAERLLAPDHQWSNWSHAFLFGERRSDGHQWVIESDLQYDRKHLRFGVQENRAAKYHDENYYGVLAVLDFGLTPEHTRQLLRESLELVARRARYSVRELLGTLLALRLPRLRGRANPLARDQSFFCSAFVRHVYRSAGIDLFPGVDVKNTTPEHISQTPLPHTAYVLDRPLRESRFQKLSARLRRRPAKKDSR